MNTKRTGTMSSRIQVDLGSSFSRLAAGLAVFTVAFALGCSSASASQVHLLLSSFDGSGTPSGGISPFGVAIDNSPSASAGDVYVTDFASRTVEKFDASGTYLPPSIAGPEGGAFSSAGVFTTEGAVNSSGDVFIGDPGGHLVDEFGPAGEDLKVSIELGEGIPTAIAIDGSDRVLIATAKAVFRYDPGTKSLSQFATAGAEGEEFAEVNGVAVDDDPTSPSFGDVYAVDSGKGTVDVFDSSGAYQSALTGTPVGPFGFAYRAVVDPTSGDLYVSTANGVDEFAPTGTIVSETAIPNGGFPSGLAISAKTGKLYVSDITNGVVDVFGPAITIPDLSGLEATSVEQTGATLHGHVDPAGGGEVTACDFEYGTSTGYGEVTSCSPAPPYSSPTEVTATITGLAPDTGYHFRIAASNTNGTAHSEDKTLETTGPPTIDGEAAVSITRNAATLQAEINPHGFDTTYEVEYGETEAYGNTLPVSPVDIGSGTTRQTVDQEIKGLNVGRAYHFRFVATNTSVVAGGDSTFTTMLPANVESISWVAGPHEATLKAKVEDFGTRSACEIEYVTEAQFVATRYANPTIVPCKPAELAGSEGELYALARPTALAPGTTYHFRFFVSNEFGEQRSQDQTFMTFGLAEFVFEDLEQGGQSYTQAGGHPYELVTKIALDTTTDHFGNEAPTGTLKDVSVQLPAGLIGNPQATAKCTRYDSEQQSCSGASQVGLIEVQTTGEAVEPEPLFNLVPPRGVAAEFGSRFNKFASAFIDAHVRSGSDYGINADSLNITTLESVTGVRVTIWGVPADPSHDEERSCRGGPSGYHLNCPVSVPLRPFLTNPTACPRTPLKAAVSADSYQAPGEFAQLGAEAPAITGCERLPFSPTIRVRPEATASDSPTGLDVDLHVPQEENPNGLAEADLKDTTVTLPRGLVINPAGAGGLTACSEAQIELRGPSPAACPDSSKVGSVELVSPLVDHPLHGAIYIAQQGNAGAAQGSNPFSSLIALYIAIDDPQTGVVVKQPGKVTLDSATGQVTATFSDIPQLPFEDLKLQFFGGPRAPLATPSMCGSFSDWVTSFDSWAEPSSGVSPVIQPFAITSGPGGSPCPSGAFTPAFTAGTQSAQAGTFSPFTLVFSRQDGEQGIAGLETTLSPGLLAKLAGVPLCGSTEAAAGECPAASQIGTVTAYAGAGPDPISVQGHIYLTGPYNGGPFGEVVEVPAVAGPFNLGTVVVRGSIRINPTTAQATVVSDSLPTMLLGAGAGVPVTLKRVIVTLDRPGFTFNPTDCDQLAITGKITGTAGASKEVSAPFQVANCAKLAFEPTFAVSTQAKSSKAGGASLRVKITSGSGQASLSKIKVALPKQLPSRFSTLQKACVAAVFEANPASCPAGSLVGAAKAVTPLLETPFTGPAYLVSHGSAGTPDLELVLQSEGVTLIQDGKTKIKNGITTSTFSTIPDAPINTIELTLPEGPHSALATFLPAKAKHSMCGQRLLMPTQITGQNGAFIEKTTRISVTGCPKKHKVKKSSKKKG